VIFDKNLKGFIMVIALFIILVLLNIKEEKYSSSSSIENLGF
jgi:ABC-type xylose transport system permease subunit